MLACSVTTGIYICMHTCLQTRVHKCKKSTLERVYILQRQTRVVRSLCPEERVLEGTEFLVAYGGCAL